MGVSRTEAYSGSCNDHCSRSSHAYQQGLLSKTHGRYVKTDVAGNCSVGRQFHWSNGINMPSHATLKILTLSDMGSRGELKRYL